MATVTCVRPPRHLSSRGVSIRVRPALSGVKDVMFTHCLPGHSSCSICRTQEERWMGPAPLGPRTRWEQGHAPIFHPSVIHLDFIIS